MKECQKDMNKKVIKRTVKGLLKDKNVIFVFGAGASLSSGIGGGKFLKEKLGAFFKALKESEKVINACQKIPDKFKGGDLKETVDNAPLESLISLGCDAFGEKTMIDWLKLYIPDVHKSKIRYFPSIVYEFVSHLANIGLIQYVVSLNYDELLDKAIEDEIGYGRCHKIATIENFERMEKEQDWGKIGRFFIIKPHGTISFPMSLRHKYKQTLEFESEKFNVLNRLFKNKILILVGYEANDEDFRLLLSEQLLLRNIEKVFIIKNDPKTVLDRLPHSKDVIGYEGRDEFFEELAKELRECEKYKKNFMGATRHFIRCKIYQNLSPGDPSLPEYNLKQEKLEAVAKKDKLFFTHLNLLLEILIFCFKVRGLFANTALISCNRIISALKEHVKECEKEKNDAEIKDILEELVKKGILKKQRIKNRLESYWYYIPISNECVNANLDAEKIKKLYKESAKKALKMLNNEYLGEINASLKKDEINDLAEKFYELQEDFDYDMGEDLVPYFLFKNPISLKKDRREFNKKTEEILSPKEADSTLYIISLTGEWLKDKEMNNINEVKVITDSEIEIKDSLHLKRVQSFQEELQDEIPNIELKTVNGIDHRITLRFKENNGEINGEAIYFYRPGKGSSIAPFYLNHGKDIEILKEFFERLWKSANHHDQGDRT